MEYADFQAEGQAEQEQEGQYDAEQHLMNEKEHAWIKEWYRNKMALELEQESERIINKLKEK